MKRVTALVIAMILLAAVAPHALAQMACLSAGPTNDNGPHDAAPEMGGVFDGSCLSGGSPASSLTDCGCACGAALAVDGPLYDGRVEHLFWPPVQPSQTLQLVSRPIHPPR